MTDVIRQARTDALEALRCYSGEELCERFQIARSALNNFVKRGQFPKPIKLGRSVRWREQDILEWLKAQSSSE